MLLQPMEGGERQKEEGELPEEYCQSRAPEKDREYTTPLSVAKKRELKPCTAAEDIGPAALKFQVALGGTEGPL